MKFELKKKQLNNGNNEKVIRPMMGHIIKLNVVVLAAGLLLPRSLLADDVVLEGVLKYRAFAPSGKLFAESQSQFRCRASTPLATNWNIRFTPAQNSSAGGTNITEYYEVGSGTGGVFRLERSNPEVVASLLQTSKSKGRSNLCLAKGLILPVDMPASEPDFSSGIVWLACSSSYFLSTNSSEGLRPVWPTALNAFVSGDYKVRAVLRRSSSTPNLLSEAVFFSPGFYPGGPPRPVRTPARPEIQKYLPPYDAGFTNALFQVSGVIRTQGMVFPSEFLLRQFRPKPGGISVSDLILAAEWSGCVTNVVFANAIADYRPLLPEGLVKINDYRFTGNQLGNLEYASSNQTWITGEQGRQSLSRAMAAENSVLAAYKQERLPGNSVRSAIRGVIILNLCIALLWFLRKYLRQTP